MTKVLVLARIGINTETEAETRGPILNPPRRLMVDRDDQDEYQGREKKERASRPLYTDHEHEGKLEIYEYRRRKINKKEIKTK